MQDTVYVLKDISGSHSAFWPPFWGAFLGIVAAMIIHFIKELIKKIETSYAAVCELEAYLGDIIKYIGSTKGLFQQMRDSIVPLQDSDYLSIQFKPDELPIPSDDIKRLSQIDLKNEWMMIKFRMGTVNSDVVSTVDAMKSKAEFYNSNREKIISSGIAIAALYVNELKYIQFLETCIDKRFDEIVTTIAKVRKHIDNKGIWIRLKNRMNFQSRYKPSQQEIEIEEAVIRAEIQDSIDLSKKRNRENYDGK